MKNHLKVVSEYPANLENPLNNFNYLPGYAAFVQAFIAAYCGLRVRDFQLDLVYPSEEFGNYQTQAAVRSQFSIFKSPVSNADSWNITGLLYRGNKLDIIYNLKSKTVEIRNRPTSNNLMNQYLEVLVYEGTATEIRPLRPGGSVTITLNTDLWNYLPKKGRLQEHNSYSNNINILASIYSSTSFSHINRPSSANLTKINTTGIHIFLILVYYFVVSVN